jgi:hypothetical protein
VVKKFHALTLQQRKEMLRSGFLPKEIKELDSVRATDTTSPAFKKMVKDRKDWKDAMILKGWTPLEVAKRVAHWYRMKKERSIWTFFRLEYGLATNRPKLTKSRFRDFLAERADISRGFGRAYGRIRSVKLSQRLGLPGLPTKKY